MNDSKLRYMHAAWHICVIAAASCHYLGILCTSFGRRHAGEAPDLDSLYCSRPAAKLVKLTR
jgi:hypothetical protein